MIVRKHETTLDSVVGREELWNETLWHIYDEMIRNIIPMVAFLNKSKELKSVRNSVPFLKNDVQFELEKRR